MNAGGGDREKLDLSGSVTIADGIYWVGAYDGYGASGLTCNPYLLMDGDEAILFDPGSVPHFPFVMPKIIGLTPLKNITNIIVTHQDPDLCGAIPRFEELIYGVGGKCKIIAHSRASILIEHYGVRSDFYNVDQHDWKLDLASGRRLEFYFTPYLHFPGAYVTYDTKSKILFSGDLFGGFSFNWSLYADQYYAEAMKAFHENYMPCKEILQRAMEKIEKLDIDMIAPQHGSIIDKNPGKYIDILKNLDCGDYLLENSP